MPRFAEFLQPLTGSSEPGAQVVLVLFGLIVLIVAASIALALALLIWRGLGKMRPALGTVEQAPGMLRGIAAIVGVAVVVLGAVAGALVTWNRMAPKPETAAAVVAPPVAAVPKPAPPASAPAPQAEARSGEMPSFPAGENYSAVREKLLARGWQPVHAPDAAPCPAGDARCQGRPETLSCSNTGPAACEFVWKQGENLLRIYTTGETPLYRGSAMMTTQGKPPPVAEPSGRAPEAGPEPSLAAGPKQ